MTRFEIEFWGVRGSIPTPGPARGRNETEAARQLGVGRNAEAYAIKRRPSS